MPDKDRRNRIGLVGCVKSKREVAAAAADLYVSPLFRGRRRYVEGSCASWFILSALHGLVDPAAVLEPYDETLVGRSRIEQRRWAVDVLEQLDRTFEHFSGLTFEIHAGKAYRDHGLVEGLQVRGASVEVPTEGLGQGRQLAFYKGQR